MAIGSLWQLKLVFAGTVAIENCARGYWLLVATDYLVLAGACVRKSIMHLVFSSDEDSKK